MARHAAIAGLDKFGHLLGAGGAGLTIDAIDKIAAWVKRAAAWQVRKRWHTCHFQKVTARNIKSRLHSLF